MPEYIFIYDHNILNGKEETNYDPLDAILYFYPSKTSIDFQLPLCCQVMGFCQILSNVFLSPPKLFTLESGANVFCIHEPNEGLITKSEKRTITFALYSDETKYDNIKERCSFLYESFIFYTNKCLSCTFKKGSRKNSKYINNLLLQLLTILNIRNRMSLIFNSSLFCDPNNDNFKSMDSLFYQTVVNIMDSVQIESKEFGMTVFGGCLFYKKMLIMNQLPTSFVNIISLIIDCLNGNTEKSGKEMFSSVKKIVVDIKDLHSRNGVQFFNVCVTHERYIQMVELSSEKPSLSNKECCSTNMFHNIHLYVENHSNMTLLFLIEDPGKLLISKEMLETFSNFCFNQLGNIANISNNISMSSTAERKCSIGQGNIWNIIYEQIDQSLSVTNSSQSQNIALDWEECLVKRASILHRVFAKEESINEVQVKVPNESLSAKRLGSQEVYTIKSSN